MCFVLFSNSIYLKVYQFRYFAEPTLGFIVFFFFFFYCLYIFVLLIYAITSIISYLMLTLGLVTLPFQSVKLGFLFAIFFSFHM